MIYKKNIFLIIFFICFIKFSFANECQNFDEKVNEAKSYFPYHNEIILNYSLRSAFIKNYNKFSKTNEKLIADKIILLTLLDRNEWYVFASLKVFFIFAF